MKNIAKWAFSVVFVPVIGSFSLLADSDASQSIAWTRLLEYRTSLRGTRSTAINQDFFASPDGATNPSAEWSALVPLFANSEQLHPEKKIPWACIFPARFQFMKRQLQANWTQPACSEFDPWKQNFPKDQISLVFSSAYKGNPASIFGHTFLVFHSQHDLNHEGRGRLLGYAVAFLANTKNESNSASYVLKGMFGGFEGAFDIQTYYETVNNYNNSENRDLWEYSLTLSDSEKSLLIDHLWEVRESGHFNYYFFDENCSWQMLSLLEAIKPDLNLKSFWQWVTVPSETIRKVRSKALASEAPTWRPSLKKKLDLQRRDFKSDELELVQQLVAGKRPIPNPRPEIWDTAVMYGHWQTQKGIANPNFRPLLKDRAEQPTSPSSVTFAPTDSERQNQPDLGHSLMFANIGALRSLKNNSSQSKNSLLIGLGLGFSDRLANQAGFEPDSGIEYFKVDTRYEPDSKKFYLYQGTLISIESFSPWTRMDHRWSWNLGLFAHENYIVNATDLDGHAGFGVTLPLWRCNLRTTAQTQFIETNVQIHDYRRANLGGELLLIHSNKNWSFEILASYYKNTLNGLLYVSSNNLQSTFAWHVQNQIDLRFTAEQIEDHLRNMDSVHTKNFQASLRRYF